MVAVSESEYFRGSLQLNRFNKHEAVDLCVYQFTQAKQNNNDLPYPPFTKDKPSGTDIEGKVFRPYKLNQLHHVHCNLDKNKNNGDPLIVYRILNNGDIRLVCITSHNEMFINEPKFVKKFSNEFPIKEEILC